jgi:peptidyl-prolyl cis-trans isomerase C
MKTGKKYYAIALTVFTLATGGMVNAAPVAASGKSSVIATINGHPITEWTLTRYASQRGMPPEIPKGEQRKALLEELINRTLIYQDAVRLGVDKTPVVQAEIEHQRINIIASTMLNRSSDRFDVTETDMKKEYENRKQELGGKELKARHILLAEEPKAKAMIEKLNNGADFSELAGKNSTGPSAMSGGDLGWFKPDQMVKPFSQAALKLNKGSYTKTPVKTQFGWHVILLEDTRSINPPKYEEIKKQIKVGLQNKLIENYIGSLRSKANIEKNKM